MVLRAHGGRRSNNFQVLITTTNKQTSKQTDKQTQPVLPFNYFLLTQCRFASVPTLLFRRVFLHLLRCVVSTTWRTANGEASVHPGELMGCPGERANGREEGRVEASSKYALNPVFLR